MFTILAEDLFSFVFGAAWLTAGTYAMLLAPWIFTVFIFSPISSLFGVLEKQRSYFSFEILTLIAWAVIFYVGGASGDPVATLALFSIGGTLIWGSKAAYLIRVSGTGYRDSTLSLIRHLLLSIAVSVPLIVGRFLDLPLIILLGIAGATAIVYYLLLFFTDTLVRREFMGVVRGLIPAKHLGWMERLGLFR
jgi:O-antigen/teichoic acid export membrane protein